jgi:ATP adenylyltransferase
MKVERLWAPWRAEYVRNPGGDGCVFCAISAAPEADTENYVLHRSELLFVILNRYPYINGHLMIVPHSHASGLGGLGSVELEAMAKEAVRCERALMEGMGCHGINGGWNMGRCAGAGVEHHLHIHMLPRWSGDVNFMSTVGGTRVLSESLDDCWNRLHPFFDPDG